MHILSVTDDDLETKRAVISGKLDRPTYLSGRTRKSNGTRFMRPRSMKYDPIGALELYLSTWTDDNRCVKREKIDDNQGNDHFYYDLREADTLHLVYPITQGELSDRLGDPFKVVGLSGGLYDQETIYPSPGEPVPEELMPYLSERRVRQDVKRKGITFRHSCSIAAPLKLRERWHLGLKVQPAAGDPFVTLHAPGWYNERPLTTIEEVNRVAMIDMDPGRCAVCTGRSGERRHIAPLQTAGQSAYLMGHLCRTCAKDAFAQWSALLDDEKPI